MRKIVGLCFAAKHLDLSHFASKCVVKNHKICGKMQLHRSEKINMFSLKNFDMNLATIDVVNMDSNCIINDKWQHVYSLKLRSLQKLKGLLECFIWWKKLDLFRFDENWHRSCCVLTWYLILNCLYTMHARVDLFHEWSSTLNSSLKIL